MDRKTFASILIILISVLGINCKKSESKHTIDATIIFVEGTVTVNNVKANNGASLHYGDVIKTGEDGICRIQIGSNNILQIGKSSELLFNISDIEHTLQLNKGWLGGITRKNFT